MQEYAFVRSPAMIHSSEPLSAQASPGVLAGWAPPSHDTRACTYQHTSASPGPISLYVAEPQYAGEQ